MPGRKARPDRPGRRLAAGRVGAAALALVSGAAEAQVVGPDPNQPGSAQVQGENGHPSGALTPTLTYVGDALCDVRGGLRPGCMYDGRLALLLDSDLEKAFGWRGASAHLSLQAIHGTGLSGDRVGNLLIVSAIEAEPTVRLFNAWVQQRLGKRASLRIGQFTASQEFMVSPTANLFVNSTFGWPGSFAADLPSGGPSYPLAAPGVRLAVSPWPSSTVLAAVFAGDPAGPGGAAPQARDRYGLNSFRFAGAPYVITEWQQALGRAKSAPVVRLGVWGHFNRFDDLEHDAQGRSLADPQASPRPERLFGDVALYAVVDARLWADAAGQRKLDGFLRASASPSDRNEVSRYVDVGLTLEGALAGRKKDKLGVAVAVAQISSDLAELARQTTAFTGAPLPAVTRETAFELTYKADLPKGFYVQPDLQWIVRPNGGQALNGAPPPRNAVVLGLRVGAQL